MNHNKMNWTLLVLALAAIVIVGGCKKKSGPARPARSPAAPAPATAGDPERQPESIQPGGSGNPYLGHSGCNRREHRRHWSVQPNGSQTVSPQSSTTYHLTRAGPGRHSRASTRAYRGRSSASLPPQAQLRHPTDAHLVAQNVKDIYFDYDNYDMRPEDQPIINADAAFLEPTHRSSSPSRDTATNAAPPTTTWHWAIIAPTPPATPWSRPALQPARLKIISYGKEKPFCTEHTEECWQSNRRDHFVYGQY